MKNGFKPEVYNLLLPIRKKSPTWYKMCTNL